MWSLSRQLPVGRCLATSIHRLANLTGRNCLLPASFRHSYSPLFSGPPTRLFHGCYRPLCQKHIVSCASSEPFILISKNQSLFLQPAPSLFNFSLLLQKPHSLWLSANVGGISLSVLEKLLNCLMDMHQN